MRITALRIMDSSRAETDGCRVRPSRNMSTYLHQDVGYKQPYKHNRTQDVQKLFITPWHHRHITWSNCHICAAFRSLPWFCFQSFLTSLSGLALAYLTNVVEGYLILIYIILNNVIAKTPCITSVTNVPKPVSYLSQTIWIDSKSIVWDYSCSIH